MREQDTADSHRTGLDVTKIMWNGKPLHVLTVIIEGDDNSRVQQSFVTQYNKVEGSSLNVYDAVTSLSKADYRKVLQDVQNMQAEHKEECVRYVLGPQTLKLLMGTVHQTMLHIHEDLSPLAITKSGSTQILHAAFQKQEEG